MKLIFKYYPKLNQLQLNILKDLSFHMTKLYNIANYLCVNQGFKSYRDLEKLLKNNWHKGFCHSHNYQQCLKVLEQWAGHNLRLLLA